MESYYFFIYGHIIYKINMFLRIWSNQCTVISRFAFNNPSHLLYQHRLVGGFCTATENTTPEKEYSFFNNLTS